MQGQTNSHTRMGGFSQDTNTHDMQARHELR